MGMPEDRNAWSAPNSDKVCYACGMPYNRPPGIGCYLKNLHSQGGDSARPESALAERVARQAEAARDARRRDRRSVGSTSSARNAPETDAEIRKRNRTAFLQGKIPQLQRKLSYLERGSGSKWEIEHVRSAITDLTSELSSLEGRDLTGRQPEGRPSLSEAPPSPPESVGPSMKTTPDVVATDSNLVPPPFARVRAEDSRRPRMPRRRFRGLRFGRPRWFRWKLVYLILFIAVFSLYFWRDIAGTSSPQDFTLWGHSLVLWYVSIPIPLLLYSLVAAFLVFIPIRALGWGAKQVARHRFAKGAATLVIVFLLIGFAVSNSPLQSKLAPSPGQFYSSLSDLGSYAAALGSQANSAAQPSKSGSVTSSGTGGATSTTSSLVTTASPPASIGFTISDPAFYNGKATISYPPDSSTLVNYALGLINQDREANGESSVTLSSISSGQQHADSMAYYGYFSHWDTQGYKPYMRYTMLGGTGGVAENGGLDYCTNSPPSATLVTPASCTLQTIESGIANSEWSMMNNDATCCNNGHRDNILDPLHNRVSIGIAYNMSNDAVYFVEDFEDAYTSFGTPFYSSGAVTLSGTTTVAIDVEEVMVAYDPLPSALTPAQLGAAPYNDGYGSGTSLGAVFAPCPQGYTCSPNTTDGGIAVYASVWNLSSGGFEIQFDPSRFFIDGPGVYTLYLFDAGNSLYTTLSIFYP